MPGNGSLMMDRSAVHTPHAAVRKEELFPDGIRCLGLAAPAGRIAPDRYEAACRFLTGLGLRIVPGRSVLKGDRLSYVSASAEERADDLNALIRDPEVQAIYCLRGGYGSVHLLESLDWSALRERKLPVVGYSDITALHAAMRKQHSGIAVSACMALQLEADSRSRVFRRNFRRAWGIAAGSSGSSGKFRKIAVLHPCNPHPMEVEAPLFCGNLTTLASLCGTPFLPKMNGKTVFLEDIAEPVRKLDRTLMQLELGGFFENCAGVIFGNFKQCGDPAERTELFRRFAARIQVPVFSGLHYGHCARSLSLVCGETAVVRNNSLYLADPFSA